MAFSVKINTRDLFNLAREYEEIGETLHEELTLAIVRVTTRARNKVVEKAPVFKGFLTNAIHQKAPIIRGRGLVKRISGEVFIAGAPALHGAVQEFGRRRGARMPPHPPLRRWVELKASRGEFELDPRRSRRAAINQAAFLVRRKISRDPAPGIRFFGRTVPEVEADLDREVRIMTDDIVRRMNL